jgi:ketosteroid isomerase-like protein
MGIERDVHDIRRVHKRWWQAMVEHDVDALRECVVPEFVLWNLTGHPYFDVDEAATVWEHYAGEIAFDGGVAVSDLRISVEGTVAYILCEGAVDWKVTGETGWAAELVGDGSRFDFRETSILRRLHGTDAEWRFLHSHLSSLAPQDEPRPAFGDTARERREPLAYVMDGIYRGAQGLRMA